LGEALGEDGENAEESGYEDGAAASEIVIHWIGGPGTCETEESGCTVDDTDEPWIILDAKLLDAAVRKSRLQS
jgi:hypothetical protein